MTAFWKMKVLIWGLSKLRMWISLSMQGWGVPWFSPLTSTLLWNLPNRRKIRGGKNAVNSGAWSVGMKQEAGNEQLRAAECQDGNVILGRSSQTPALGLPGDRSVRSVPLCPQRVEKMTKGVPRLTGVKGRLLERRHPCRNYVGIYVQWGSQAGQGNIPSREELVTHSLILLYPLFLFKRLFCWGMFFGS